ncbi:DUF4012 domain-containing protein [Bifidobacterium simiarum]|uniref:DUF4012 domain-containing protein n=1 Tax=Bifidobacterium simiarum TaxID=2045441 RepID=UPI0010547D0A|nr:DUF4012 domain-containing protein [Bifidobacterium simiarum]
MARHVQGSGRTAGNGGRSAARSAAAAADWNDIISQPEPSASRRSGGRRGHRPERKRHTGRNVVLTILLILVVLAAVGGFLGLRFYKQALEVRDHETKAVQAVTALADLSSIKDTQSLNSAIAEAKTHTSAAKTITDGALWKAASLVPVYGDDVKTVRGMTGVMDAMVGEALPSLSNNVATLMNANLSAGDSQLNLKPLQDVRTSFSKTNQLVQQQKQTLDALPQPHVGMVKSAYEQSRSQFDTIAEKIDQIDNSLQFLPKFLGSEGNRNYLLMAQTTSESRSSGGLVGSLGSMTTANGKITMGDFHPNTEFNLKGVLTDEETNVFSELEVTTDPRNAPVLPNFPHVAEILNKTWQASPYAGQVDGVIAVDPVFIQQMVKINGSIKLPDGRVLTGDNTAEFMLNTIYKEIPEAQQNDYFEYIVSTAISQMFANMNTSKLMQVANSMGDLASNRHLYMYSFHADEAKNFQGAGLAKGTPSSEENPELGLYVTEMKTSKMTWYIHRKTTITRQECNADGSQTYHVRVAFTNTVPSSDVKSEYEYIVGKNDHYGPMGTAHDAMLFYAPKGGSISNFTTNADEKPSQTTIDGETAWLSKTNISPGSTVSYEFDVKTSTKAKSDLKLDQTPMGWMDPGVTYDTAACAIKQ